MVQNPQKVVIKYKYVGMKALPRSSAMKIEKKWVMTEIRSHSNADTT